MPEPYIPQLFNLIQFQAGIYYNGVMKGGATILNNEWILTAAHVVTDPSTSLAYPESSIKVFVGSNVDFGVTELNVDNILVHSGFDYSSLSHDIALLHLSAPLTFSSSVQPINYSANDASPSLAVDQIGVASGWGMTGPNDGPTFGNPATTLMETNVKISGILSDIIQTTKPDPNGQPQGVCFGDSGGPLTLIDPTTNTPKLIGVISAVYGSCASSNAKHVRVSAYAGWIYEKTGIHHMSLSGPSSFCNSATYSISNLPTGATVSWALSDNALGTISSSGSTATITRTGYGSANLTATITLNGNNIVLTKPITLGYKQPTMTVNGGNTWGGSKFYIIGNTEPGISYRLEVTTPGGAVYTALSEVSLDELGKYWVRLYITNSCVTEKLVYTNAFISVDDGGPIN